MLTTCLFAIGSIFGLMGIRDYIKGLNGTLSPSDYDDLFEFWTLKKSTVHSVSEVSEPVKTKYKRI